MRNFITRHNIKRYFSISKYYLLISVVIFILSLIVGAYLSITNDPTILDLLNTSLQNIADTPLTFLDITLNNIQVSIMIIIGGILFSIFSALIIFYNGLIIGFLGARLPIVFFLAYILPHGIFELPALLFSCVLAFMITHMICRIIRWIVSRNVKFTEMIRNSYPLLKAMVVTFVIAMVLFVIAGFIESNITEIIGNLIVMIYYY